MGDKPEKIDAPPPCHNVAKVAQEGFGKNAAAYDEHRPGYTEKIVELILEEISVPSAVKSEDCLKYEVLELGAGTGNLTELVAPKRPSGYRYLATEPSKQFLNYLKAKSLPIDTANSSASDIPLPDNSVLNVVCAQSLHWFSNEVSLREIHRVLVPGGKLISVWNIKKYEEGKWTIEVYNQRLELMERTGLSSVNWVNSMGWKKAFDSARLFSCARHESLPGIDYQCDLDTLLTHLRTISCYNALPLHECQAYLDRLKVAILRYQDVAPEKMVVPFCSEMYVFQAV